MKSLNFPLSKRALIKLPPEAELAKSIAKTLYAQRVNEDADPNIKEQVNKDANNEELSFLNERITIKLNTRLWTLYNIESLLIPPTINLHITELPAQANDAAFWDPTNNTLAVYIKPYALYIDTIHKYNEQISFLNANIDHEFRHIVQTLIDKTKNLKEKAGLPKNPNPLYTPLGFNKSLYTKYSPLFEKEDLTKEDQQHLNLLEQTRLPHDLQDVEYHAILADAVKEFKDNYTPTNNNIKTFLKLNPFFKALTNKIQDSKNYLQSILDSQNVEDPKDLPPSYKKLYQNVLQEYNFFRQRLHIAFKQFIKEIL